jgi:hypothetical protein
LMKREKVRRGHLATDISLEVIGFEAEGRTMVDDDSRYVAAPF